MTNEEIIKEFNALPLEARKQVIDFIAFLRQRYSKKNKQKITKDLREEEFIGMWKDREDKKDSTAWVRKLRGSERIK